MDLKRSKNGYISCRLSLGRPAGHMAGRPAEGSLPVSAPARAGARDSAKDGAMGPFAARFAPVLLMVGAKVPYSVIQKLTPPEVDAFSSLCLTYGVCTACAVALFFLTRRGAGGSGRTLRGEWSKATWTAPVFGACLLCMDVATLAKIGRAHV